MALKIYHFRDDATDQEFVVLSHQGPKHVINDCAQGLTLLGALFVEASEAAPGAEPRFNEHTLPLDRLLSPEEV